MNIREIIYLNCGETYKDLIDHRSYAHNLSSCEMKAWKKKHSDVNAPNWLDSSVSRALHRRSTFSFKPEFFSGFIFTTAQVVCITAMINHKFISFSAVQIYDISYSHLHSSLSTGILRTHNVTSSQMDGLIAQSVVYSTAPVSQRSWVRIPFRHKNSQLLKLCA